MEKKFIHIGLLSFLLIITSCTKIHQTREAVECKTQCKFRHRQCIDLCKNSCQQCAVSRRETTEKNYLRYRHQQCIQGKIIARELKSYRDPLQCRKTTCNCWADYNVCMQSCSGLILKRLQVAPTCC